MPWPQALMPSGTDVPWSRTPIWQKPVSAGDLLAGFGGGCQCLMADPQVAAQARQRGLTRAHVAVEQAAGIMKNGIYVVGNAPTALLCLLDMIKMKEAEPALVVGLPVGFVNAAESKAALVETDISYISNVGRKGGSNVAASVINALALIAADKGGRR